MDNQTLYRSPVRLVSHAGEPIGEFSPQTISRSKKKLLALISLSDNEMELNGLVYTKNDIISLLDSITDETIWRHHCTVYAFPALLAFLEEGFFDDEELSREVIANSDEAFLAFLSHPFAVAFNKASSSLLRPQSIAPPQPTQPLTYDPMSARNPTVQIVEEPVDRFEILADLMGYQRFITLQHQHLAFERIRVYFHDLLYTLRNLSWEKFREDESVLHFVFSTSWMHFANKLPMSFSGTRDEVVDNVTNIALRFQHKATWHYLHLLCEDLKMLECNDGLKEEVSRLAKHFERNANVANSNQNSSNQKSSSPSTGRVIVWIIWAILGLVRLSHCASSSSSYGSYDYPSTKFEYPTVVPADAIPQTEIKDTVFVVKDSAIPGKKHHKKRH